MHKVVECMPASVSLGLTLLPDELWLGNQKAFKIRHGNILGTNLVREITTDFAPLLVILRSATSVSTMLIRSPDAKKQYWTKAESRVSPTCYRRMRTIGGSCVQLGRVNGGTRLEKTPGVERRKSGNRNVSLSQPI